MINISLFRKLWVRVLTAIVLFSIQLSCNSPDANSCFKAAGDEVTKTYELEAFNNILINRNVEAVIKMGTNYEVEVVSGENLIDDIIVSVVGQELVITDNNICNLVRDYGNSTVYITVPDLKRIRSSTQYDISSNGILTFPDLSLISENFNNPDLFSVGDFRLNLIAESLTIVSNNISSFYLSGSVDQLNVNFFGGVGRFEGPELISQHVEIYHRGSNDMILNPQQSIRGEILGTGNAIILSAPDIIDVQESYVGSLIIQD